MDNTSHDSGRRSGGSPSGRGRGGRNRSRGGRNRNRSRGGVDGANEASRGPRRNNGPRKPAKKKNPILALLGKLFGGKSAGKPTRKSNARKSDSERDRRSRDGANGTGSTKSAAREESLPQVISPRLYIGNLSYDTTESDLFDHFATVGNVKNAEVVRDRSERSKGFGFVEMNSVEMAQTAAEKFHRTDFMGREIIVSGAKN